LCPAPFRYLDEAPEEIYVKAEAKLSVRGTNWRDWMNSHDSEVKQQIRTRFANVARSPESEQVFPVGPDSAKMLGYVADEIDGFAAEVTESFSGVGNPLSVGHVETGHTVLDLGCGAGLDSILAAKHVGPTGTVIALDMTAEMLDKAKRNAVSAGVNNIKFHLGEAEELPVADETVNAVITNGVFNLCLNKPKVLAELHRVLRRGGYLQMADILLHDGVPEEEAAGKGTWSD
jgi:SAM-dependent methyltransferase